jgi:hypothetical protein
MVGLIYAYSNPGYPEKTLEELTQLRARLSAERRPVSRALSKTWSLARRLGEGAVADLIAKYVAGSTTIELAAEYDISKSGLNGLLRKSGVQLRLQSMSDGQVQIAAARYVEGAALSQLAEELPFSQETIRKALLRAGVQLRPPRR